MYKIFISCAEADNSSKEKLLQHLTARIQAGEIRADHGESLQGGANENVRKVLLANADLVVFLLSASFLPCKKISQFDLPAALENRYNGRQQFLVAKVKSCSLKSHPLENQGHLFDDGDVVESEQRWAELAEKAMELLNARHSPGNAGATRLSYDCILECDRSLQFGAFLEHTVSMKNCGFFYTLGAKKHWHDGLVKRIARWEAGTGPNTTDSEASLRIKQFKIQVETFRDFGQSMIHLRQSFLQQFNLSVRHQTDFQKEGLSYLLRQGFLSHTSYNKDTVVCIQLVIRGRQWRKGSTNRLLQAFAEQLMNKELPPESPMFLIFFNIVTKESEENAIHSIKADLSKHHLTCQLPVLQRVDREDVEHWIEEHYSPADTEQEVQQLMNQHFADTSFSMQFFNKTMRFLIDEYNRKIIYR